MSEKNSNNPSSIFYCVEHHHASHVSGASQVPVVMPSILQDHHLRLRALPGEDLRSQPRPAEEPGVDVINLILLRRLCSDKMTLGQFHKHFTCVTYGPSKT